MMLAAATRNVDLLEKSWNDALFIQQAGGPGLAASLYENTFLANTFKKHIGNL